MGEPGPHPVIGGYQAAQEEVVLLVRPARRLLRVAGLAPTQMFSGLLTGTTPPALQAQGVGIYLGHVPYSAMLTPKGRLVTDLRVARLTNGDDGSLLLDLPEAGATGALAHFEKFLPPRLAKIVELAEPVAMVTLVGPDAPQRLSDGAVGFPVDAPTLLKMKEGDEWIASDGSEIGIRVVRTADVSPLAFDILGSATTIDVLRLRLVEAGVPVAEEGLWDVLRLENGRPEFGVELDERTMPAEAGIQQRCIDETKGCYTGQEVVVRIRDRGHVNRYLRGILFGDTPSSKPGTPLFQPGQKRPAGTIRSFVLSPRFDQGIALGYLRREVEPPAVVTIGDPTGPEVKVRALSDDGWLLVEGDPTFYP